MLGYWLAAAPRRREAFNVTYAFVTSITPNADCPKRGWGNGLYKAPNNVSILLHHIKNPSWLPYVWRVAAEGLEYQPEECARARVLSPHISPPSASPVSVLRPRPFFLPQPHQSHTTLILCARWARSRRCYHGVMIVLHTAHYHSYRTTRARRRLRPRRRCRRRFHQRLLLSFFPPTLHVTLKCFLGAPGGGCHTGQLHWPQPRLGDLVAE